MGWLATLGLAVGLGMDAMAVSVVAGSRRNRISFRPLFRLSFHFGLFQFLMPIIGWAVGMRIEQYIRQWDHWIAFGLLLAVGARMIWEASDSSVDREAPADETRGWTLVMLSVATSIDALAVGLTMAFLRVDVWAPSVVIGLVAALMTAVGMMFGRRLGSRFGRRMGLVGGLVLIGIGVKIVLEHLA